MSAQMVENLLDYVKFQMHKEFTVYVLMLCRVTAKLQNFSQKQRLCVCKGSNRQ